MFRVEKIGEVRKVFLNDDFRNSNLDLSKFSPNAQKRIKDFLSSAGILWSEGTRFDHEAEKYSYDSASCFPIEREDSSEDSPKFVRKTSTNNSFLSNLSQPVALRMRGKYSYAADTIQKAWGKSLKKDTSADVLAEFAEILGF